MKLEMQRRTGMYWRETLLTGEPKTKGNSKDSICRNATFIVAGKIRGKGKAPGDEELGGINKKTLSEAITMTHTYGRAASEEWENS